MFLIYLVTPPLSTSIITTKKLYLLYFCLNHINNVNMFQLNYLTYTLKICIITICTFYCQKRNIFNIHFKQASICFHGNGKKEVNLIHVFTVYKIWRPLSSIGSMRICHHTHHYWENLFKNH